MPVNSTHPEYDNHHRRWKLVRDVVTSKVKQYIHPIDPGDNDRTQRYRNDARLTNFTSRTKSGLVGAVFRRDPEIQLPESLEYLNDDATGSQLTLTKLSQEVTGEVLQSGRYGLLVDFPASQEGLTAAEVENLDLKARIHKYTPESIINWQCTFANGKHQLALVVLEEHVASLAEDGFTWTGTKQYRVLRLIDGVYVQQVYTEDNQLLDESIPLDFNGNNWGIIPFVFVGAEDNDPQIDIAPLYDLAELNIGHLRNSADYEESVHVTGQPTLMISTSLSQEAWAKANPNGVLIGARRGHYLGENGNAILLQAAPNQLADEAMKRKEEQAVMLGARLITQVGGNETAEKARIVASGENSVLSNIAKNVSDAIVRCLNWVDMFMSSNPNPDNITFKLNDQFFDSSIDPQIIMAQLQLFNNGIIAKEDVRSSLRKTGLINPDRTDEDIDEDVDNLNPLEDL